MCGASCLREVPQIKKSALSFCTKKCFGAYRGRVAAADFWKRVEHRNGCWEWQGAVNACGYGIVSDGLAHRAVWIAEKGPIPDGMNICHTCDNPRCVSINHLFCGTQRDNIQDMFRKRRNSRTPDSTVAAIIASSGSCQSTARLLGVSPHTVMRYRNGISRKKKISN